MEKEEILYKTGFNSGYLISKHQPELFEKLKDNLNPENPYMNGLFDGKEQMEQEKSRQITKSPEIQKDIDRNKSRDMDRER